MVKVKSKMLSKKKPLAVPKKNTRRDVRDSKGRIIRFKSFNGNASDRHNDNDPILGGSQGEKTVDIGTN